MQSDMYMLQREAEFLSDGEKSFEKLWSRLQIEGSTESSTSTCDSSAIELKIAQTKLKIRAAREKRLAVQHRRTLVATKLHQSRLLREALSERINALSYQSNCLRDHMESLKEESMRSAVKLQKLMQLNAVNDAFYVWYSGPFGTINNFRLGNLPIKPIEWTEINAALGQAVLAVAIVAAKAGYEFKKYFLGPMGSFPKVYRADDPGRRNPMQLYQVEGNFQLFAKKNFNVALTGFMTCVHELGEFIRSRDPTLALPYNINLSDGKIFDQPFAWDRDDEKESWTRALKFLLTDIKWLVAWATKHC